MRLGLALFPLCAVAQITAWGQSQPLSEEPPPEFNGQVISGIEFRGCERLPEGTRRARFRQAGRESEPADGGARVIFVPSENRPPRSIRYAGPHPAGMQEIMDRLMLTVDHAAAAIEDFRIDEGPRAASARERRVLTMC
jgi:hypothetical protein